MPFEKENKDGITILKVPQDRLDSTIAPQLKAELLLLVDQGLINILVDLTGVAYVDSSGLGALLFGVRQLRPLDGALRIFAAGDRILNLMRIAKLEDVILNFKDEEEALKSFRS